MPVSYLADRGVVSVRGAEARTFLNGLVTCDMNRISQNTTRFGALLTPQGKILCDFLIFQAPGSEEDGFLFDAPRACVADLVKRLNLYKLRARVTVADLSEILAIIAGWGDVRKPATGDGVIADDPRLPTLGWRGIVPLEAACSLGQALPETYHAHRIALGIPEGGKDFAFVDAFPHEAQMDQLRGVDFDKGCYVGQEVVSRMQHRGTARTRIVPVRYPNGGTPEPGIDVTDEEKIIGKTGSGAGNSGLAMLRLDKADEAIRAGRTILAGGQPVALVKPGWIGYPFPGDSP